MVRMTAKAGEFQPCPCKLNLEHQNGCFLLWGGTGPEPIGMVWGAGAPYPNRGESLRPGEPPDGEPDGGEGNQGLQGPSKVLEVLGEAAISPEPGKRALGQPATAGQRCRSCRRCARRSPCATPARLHAECLFVAPNRASASVTAGRRQRRTQASH